MIYRHLKGLADRLPALFALLLLVVVMMLVRLRLGSPVFFLLNAMTTAAAPFSY